MQSHSDWTPYHFRTPTPNTFCAGATSGGVGQGDSKADPPTPWTSPTEPEPLEVYTMHTHELPQAAPPPSVPLSLPKLSSPLSRNNPESIPPVRAHTQIHMQDIQPVDLAIRAFPKT